MLRSMTGYAQAQAEEGGWVMRATLKSVNHRFLDLRLRLPDEIAPAEPRLRALARDRVQRGHLDITFQVENAQRQAAEVNEEIVRRYLDLYRRLQKEYSLSGEPELGTLLRLPGALRSGPAAPTPEENEHLMALAENLLAEGLNKLDGMRTAEGSALARDLRGCVERIRAGEKQLRNLSERALPGAHQRLSERLRELLGETNLDSARLAEEAAYLAERRDIREELTRLQSHAAQFLELLESDGAVGKQLDFLVQEMNRETTTALSKSPGLEAEGLEITRIGLEIKAEIERLREQVQNVE